MAHATGKKRKVGGGGVGGGGEGRITRLFLFVHHLWQKQKEKEGRITRLLAVPTFSDPARSTRYSFPVSVFLVSLFSCLMLIRNTA